MKYTQEMREESHSLNGTCGHTEETTGWTTYSTKSDSDPEVDLFSTLCRQFGFFPRPPPFLALNGNSRVLDASTPRTIDDAEILAKWTHYWKSRLLSSLNGWPSLHMSESIRSNSLSQKAHEDLQPKIPQHRAAHWLFAVHPIPAKATQGKRAKDDLSSHKQPLSSVPHRSLYPHHTRRRRGWFLPSVHIQG